MSEDFFPVVLKVKPQDNFHVEVYFNDGKIVDYDAGAVLQGEVFAPLRDLATFLKRPCRIIQRTEKSGLLFLRQFSANRTQTQIHKTSFCG